MVADPAMAVNSASQRPVIAAMVSSLYSSVPHSTMPCMPALVSLSMKARSNCAVLRSWVFCHQLQFTQPARGFRRVLQAEHHPEHRVAAPVIASLPLHPLPNRANALVAVRLPAWLHVLQASSAVKVLSPLTHASQGQLALMKNPISPSSSCWFPPATGVPTQDVFLPRCNGTVQHFEGRQQGHGRVAPCAWLNACRSRAASLSSMRKAVPPRL